MQGILARARTKYLEATLAAVQIAGLSVVVFEQKY
jgi:hypothetical protein